MNDIVSVIIVDDHKIFRTGLELILNNFRNVKVVGQAGDGKQLLNLLKKTQADIVFMDIRMPGMDGIEATHLVAEKYPGVKVIGLTMYSDIEYFNKMLEAGASGYLLKNSQEQELETAIDVVLQGDYYFSEIFRNSLEQRNLFGKKPRANIRLSKREIEILGLIAQGMSNHEIANQLNISAYTVDGHRRNLISKTGVKNSANLVMYAIKNGFIDF
jgi:DNA-binding NarL/FixJ family response regulator